MPLMEMFAGTGTGISLKESGNVTVVELSANLRGVSLNRAAVFPGEGETLYDCWSSALRLVVENGFSMERVVVGIPAVRTFQRTLSFPFTGRRRINQVLPSELEGEIPIPSDESVSDFISFTMDKHGCKGVAVACEKELLREVLKILPAGISPAAIQTDALGLAAASVFGGIRDGGILYCSEGEAIAVGLASGRPVAIRRRRLAGEPTGELNNLVDMTTGLLAEGGELLLACGSLLEPMLAAFNEAGVSRVKTARDWAVFNESDFSVSGEAGQYLPALGLALRALGRRESSPFDLRQGPFKPENILTGLKEAGFRTAILAGLVVLLGAGYLWGDYTAAKDEYQTYAGTLKSSFQMMFPDARIVNAVAQLEEKISTLQKKAADYAGFSGRTALSVMADLGRAIPSDLDLKLNELSLDSGRLRLEGTAPSFDVIDRIKSALDKSGKFKDVKVQNARVGADPSKVSFRLQMEVL